MFDTVCFGQMAGCDLIFSNLPHMPVPGQDVQCEEFLIKAGGAANTPIGLSRLGVSTCLFTRLGTDMLGVLVRDILHDNGVSTEHVIMDRMLQTTVSAVLSMKNERGFASYFDHTPYQYPREAVFEAIRDCRGVFSDVLTCRATPEILEAAKAYHKELYLDIGYTDGDRVTDYEDILRQATLFFPNEQEALSLTDAGTIQEAAGVLSSYVETVVIKLGKKGCLIKTADTDRIIPTREEPCCLDTTGAGDLFAAGFIQAWQSGKSLVDCGRIANAAGGLAVTFIGGYDDAFTREKVYERAGMKL